MSLDDRCHQFHEAALGTGKSKATAREIATLRKFLHRNQDQRFSDKAAARIFDTIQVYVVQKSADEVTVDLKEGLLEDSLKMPFTVFSTKQKQKMIKWLEGLRGGGDCGPDDSGIACDRRCNLSVIELVDGTMTLMSDETGDTFEGVSLPNGELGKAIQVAFEGTEGVLSVEAILEGVKVGKIVRLVEEQR